MNKHTQTILFLLILLGTCAAALPAAAKDRAVASAWTETAVKIDGQDPDWTGASLQTIENLGIDYAFKNDGSNLYVLFIFKDPRSLSSIEATGMTLHISTDMKKSKDRGLLFRKKTVTPQELIALLEKEGQTLSDERKQGILARESYAIFGWHLIDKKGKIIAENVGRMTPNPPSFSQAKKENSVIYEFRVPLARTEAQPAGIGGEPGMSLKVGFAWGGLTAEMRKALAKESGYAGGQTGENPSSSDIVTEGMGPGEADSDSTLGSRIAQMQRQFKKYEFWVDVLLAVSFSGYRKEQPKAERLSAEDAAARVNALADEYVKETLARFPEQATMLGLAEAPQDRLTDNSLEALRAWQEIEDRWAAELSRIDASSLWGRPEWQTFGFLREIVEASRGARIARYELWPVNHMSGWQAGLAQLAAVQPVGTPERRAQSLARWRMIPRYIDTEILNLREGLRLGYTAPKLTVPLVIGQLDAILAAPIESSPFFSPAERDATPEFKEAWRSLLADEINPAIRRYRDFLDKEYLAGAREAIGISALPNGPEIYRALFRSATTLDRPAEETFRLGQEAVRRYEAEAAAIGKEIAGTSELAAIRAKITADPGNYFKDRADLLAFSKDAVERARLALPQWFLTIPKAAVVVEPIPAFLEQTASSGYESAAADGSRPGTYRINLYQPEKQMRSTMEVTAFHETYPGHHFQISVAMERPTGHLITRLPVSAGYIEGWARYSEALAEEMGLYTSAYARIGRRLWPAHGMVVDPGIHVMGWTRQQAIDFVFATGRFSTHEAESLIDRVIVWPAQLTSYDTGALEFFALRKKAEEAFGPKFDIKAFHDQLLKYGSVTLPMLREIIERWLAESK